MAIVFGFLGMMVAVPVLAVVMVTVRMLYVEDVVGDDVGAADTPEPPVPPSRPSHTIG
jgi:predicted PurR-regulated permease PerM